MEQRTQTLTQPPSPAPWPAGVTARFLTKAAEIIGDHELTVDLANEGSEFVRATCRACRATHFNEPRFTDSDVRPWAVRHADACRALPRPAATA